MQFFILSIIVCFVFLNGVNSSLFLWSRNDQFQTKNSYNLDRLSLNDVANSLANIAMTETSNVLPIYYLTSDHDLEEYKPFLEQNVLQDPSTLSSSVSPYLYDNQPEGSNFINLLRDVNVLVEEVELKDALHVLESRQFAKPTILIISIPSSPSSQTTPLMTSISQFLSTHQKSDVPTTTGALFHPTVGYEGDNGDVRRKLIYADSTYVYMTPELLAGILTGIFFLVVVWVGLSCMGGILTPSHMPLKAPAKGREF